jgi:hypothetical protein
MAIALFIVSVLITFDSTDGVEPWIGRGERRVARIKFRQAFSCDKLCRKACHHSMEIPAQNSAKPGTDFVTIGSLILAPPSRFCSV